MKKVRLIPTFFAIIVLILGISLGVVLIKQGSKFFLKANPDFTPKQVKISNVTDSSFSVSWITDSQTSGFVNYGPNEDLIFTAEDDRDQISGKVDSFLVHHVTIRDLKPATTYFFEIESGGETFDNNGESYQVTTAPTIQAPAPANDVAYGSIISQNGSPMEGVIIYLSLPNASPLSTLTKTSGNWVIPLNLGRSTDLSSWASYDKEATIEEIFVQGGVLGTATAVGVTKYDSPLPTITLGQSYDFRKAPVEPTATPTNQVVSLDNRLRGNQGFSSASVPLAIINPHQGEKINSSRPEFMGTGPKGEKLKITLNSTEATNDQVTIDESGSWAWTPPKNLAPGEHIITVTLSDGKKIVRNFTILASEGEGLPYFSASPSATLTPTISISPKTSPTPTLIITPSLRPTQTITPTLISRTSRPSTDGGVPKSGYLTPTFLLSIIGVVLIGLGLVIKISYRKTL